MTKNQTAGSLLRNYPFAAVCAGVVIFLSIALVFRWGAMDGARSELDRQESEGSQIEKNVANAVGLEEHLGLVKDGVSKLESKLITVDDVSGNQEYFYRLEATSGVRLSILRPLGVAKTVQANATYRPAGFNVVVEGEYTQIIAFLRAVETGAHLYRLVDFSLQRASQQAESSSSTPVVLNVNLQLLASKQ